MLIPPGLSDSLPLDDVAPYEGLNVLVVDDHPANRRVIEIMLGDSIQKLSVDNGLKAVEAARVTTFDLILMDMHMPVLDGVAATRQIRADERAAGRAPVPLFMLTANDLDEYIDMGQEAGADGHLVKPMSSALLREVLRRAVRR